jgi:hypothetical protein
LWHLSPAPKDRHIRLLLTEQAPLDFFQSRFRFFQPLLKVPHFGPLWPKAQNKLQQGYYQDKQRI